MDSGTAIEVKNLGKIYRIGKARDMNDNLGSALLSVMRRPLDNFRKYRSLYRFDDVDMSGTTERDDILWSLRDVSFAVQRGEVLGIIGRNGAGKSTLLKILSRITPPTYGRVEVRGRISSLLEVGTGFHPELTGRENVYLNGTILGMSKREVNRKFDEIAAFADIDRFLDTPVKRYSTGMKVRLAFAVAAHLEPEILIIDEVLAVGDASFQRKCLNKMEDVGKDGRTVLFVSHNVPAVTRLCTRVVMLDKGRLVQDGSPGKVISAYMTEGGGTAASVQWSGDDAPGGAIARLRAVRVRDEAGEVGETIDIRRPCVLEMEFDMLQPGRKFLPHFHLLNAEGTHLFTTLDTDTAWRDRPRPPGRYLSRAHIPGNLLADGAHYVHVGGVTLDPVTSEFFEREVVMFQVIDSSAGDTARGPWTGEMYGTVRPYLDWETQFAGEGVFALPGKLPQDALPAAGGGRL